MKTKNESSSGRLTTDESWHWSQIGVNAGDNWANDAALVDVRAWHRTATWAAKTGFKRENFPLPNGWWESADESPLEEGSSIGSYAEFAKAFYSVVDDIVRELPKR